MPSTPVNSTATVPPSQSGPTTCEITYRNRRKLEIRPGWGRQDLSLPMTWNSCGPSQYQDVEPAKLPVKVRKPGRIGVGASITQKQTIEAVTQIAQPPQPIVRGRE